MKNTQKGFGLIDTVVAIALLGIIVMILGLIYPGLRLSNLNKSYIIANSITQDKMEELRAIQFDTLALENNAPFTHSSLGELDSASASYTVELYDADGDSNLDDDIKKVTVQVTWSEKNETKNVTLNSLSSKTGLAR